MHGIGGACLFTAPCGVQLCSFGHLALLVRRLNPQYRLYCYKCTFPNLVFLSFVGSLLLVRSVLAQILTRVGTQKVLTCTSSQFQLILSLRDTWSRKAHLCTIHESVSRLLQKTSWLPCKNMESIHVSFIPNRYRQSCHCRHQSTKDRASLVHERHTIFSDLLLDHDELCLLRTWPCPSGVPSPCSFSVALATLYLEITSLVPNL